MFMNNRVGILSRHAVPNYGSILQAFALQDALNSMGVDAEYVDYRIPRDFPLADAMRTSGVLGPIRAIPKAIGALKFEAMRKGLLKQSRRVTDVDGLGGLLAEYPVLCVGGDQVWNVMSDGNIEGAYLLEGAPDGAYKFSFSSSFGKNGLDARERDRATKALARFNRLSVREESGQKTLEEMGLKAQTVVDPVHLLSKETWFDRVEPRTPRGVSGKYCLIYNLHPSEAFDRYSAAACESLGIEVVSVRPSLRKTMGKNLFYPSLHEFLWLFDNAACVLTDSFHGTAFSLLFNTPFVDILPEQYAERNKAILSRYGLESRISTELQPEELRLGDFDWAGVNELLATNRRSSTKFLAETVDEFSARLAR